MLKTKRVMEYSRGKAKPGGTMTPNQSRMVVTVDICEKCKRVGKFCTCGPRRTICPSSCELPFGSWCEDCEHGEELKALRLRGTE